jgi:NADPH:quinone reductase-like Zn-dependent oxidoreductase
MQKDHAMHAIVHRRYGTPEVLAFEEIERPVPGDEDVLVRVHAAGATIGDHHIVTGRPYLCRAPEGGGDWVGPFVRILGGLISSLFTSRKFKTFVMTPNRDDLLFLKELVEAGKARPVIERSYALREVAEALRHVGEGRAQGQIVIRIAS